MTRRPPRSTLFPTTPLFLFYVYGPLRALDRHSQAAHWSGSALGAGRDRGAARDPAPPARGRRQLRSHDRVRGARARARGRGDRREIGEPRSAGREAGARRDRGAAGWDEADARLRTRRPDGDPAGWAAGLGENHHRGEARAAVEARAKGAGAGGSRSLSAGGWGTAATAG